MAKIAAEKARKVLGYFRPFLTSFQDREERKNAQKLKQNNKADIDDTKENVMDDLLSALASSGPGNQVSGA